MLKLNSTNKSLNKYSSESPKLPKIHQPFEEKHSRSKMPDDKSFDLH
jgi:hypothetical protein